MSENDRRVKKLRLFKCSMRIFSLKVAEFQRFAASTRDFVARFLASELEFLRVFLYHSQALVSKKDF